MKNTKFPIQCLVVAWLVAISNYIIALYFGAEWFSRSGSIIVLFSVMAEYALLQERHKVLSDKLENYGGFDAGNVGDIKPKDEYQKQEIAAHITIVIGTLIWGYGDLFIVNA